MVSLIAFGSGQGTGHCPAGIFKNIISNVTKNEEAGHGPVPCPLNFGLQMPHFASRNTQHLLKTSFISSLFLQNPCTIQINALPLQHENPPSLSTMLKCAGRFFICTYGKQDNIQ